MRLRPVFVFHTACAALTFGGFGSASATAIGRLGARQRSTMLHFRVLGGAALAMVFIFISVPSTALASATYTYQGNDFTYASGPYATAMSLSGSVTLSSALAASATTDLLATLESDAASLHSSGFDNGWDHASGGHGIVTANPGVWTTVQVPEPSTAAPLALGLVGIAAVGRRRAA
jgi:hypothetical protein